MAGQLLDLGRGAFKRTYGREPEIEIFNRFFENNPSNRENAVALLSRMGTTFRAGLPKSPVRANFFQQGTLGGKLFTVGGNQLYQFDFDFTRTDLLGVIAGSPDSTPSMCGTDKIWIADGQSLQFYDGVGSRAKNTLVFPSNPKGGNTITLGAQTYTYQLTLINGGAANEILVGATQAESIQNFVDAVNHDLGEGARYGTNTQVNPYAVAYNELDGMTVTATAKTGGAAGNAVATTSVLGGAYAAGTLTFTPGTVATQTFQIGGVYYIFTPTPLSNPLAAGTSANPWQVLATAGASATQPLLNLLAAINASGTAGVTYSTALTAHPTVRSVSSTTTTLVVNALSAGTSGNAISTTVPAGAGFAWGAATLAGGTNGATGWTATTLLGGVNNALSGVPVPDDLGIVSVAAINGYVLCAVANSNKIFIVRPGEITIDALDFFSAQATASEITSLLTVGDQVWIFKADTTQAVYESGADDIPFSFITGRAFQQGVLSGTACILDTEVALVGDDDIVYLVSGGPKPISDQGISERIRKARVAERDAP